MQKIGTAERDSNISIFPIRVAQLSVTSISASFLYTITILSTTTIELIVFSTGTDSQGEGQGLQAGGLLRTHS